MYKKWRLKRAQSYVSFLFTSGLKETVSHERALNSRAGTDAQADEGLSSVIRVSVKTTYVLHSLNQGVFGSQLGTRVWDEYPDTRGSGRVDKLPGYKFTTRYPNANHRMHK